MGQISRITTWASGQQPTAPALNGEFDNFLNTWNQTDTGVLTWSQVKVTAATSVPLIANATGTQNIANFQSSGTVVSSISNAGMISNQFGACPGILYVGGSSSIITNSQSSLISTTPLIGSRTLSANSLRVGSIIKIAIYGSFTVATFPCFMNLNFNIGNSTIDSFNAAFSLTTNANFFRSKIIFVTKAIGASANGSTFISMMKDRGGTTDAVTTSESNSTTTSTSFDSTANQSIDVLCSFTNASDSIQALGSHIEVIY